MSRLDAKTRHEYFGNINEEVDGVRPRKERWAMTRRGRREVKLSQWAREQGINLRTAQRMHSRGELPVPAKITSTGRIMVIVEIEERRPLTNSELTNMLFSLKGQLDRIERKLDHVA